MICATLVSDDLVFLGFDTMLYFHIGNQSFTQVLKYTNHSSISFGVLSHLANYGKSVNLSP